MSAHKGGEKRERKKERKKVRERERKRERKREEVVSYLRFLHFRFNFIFQLTNKL